MWVNETAEDFSPLDRLPPEVEFPRGNWPSPIGDSLHPKTILRPEEANFLTVSRERAQVQGLGESGENYDWKAASFVSIVNAMR
jgi:hypothetical protein